MSQTKKALNLEPISYFQDQTGIFQSWSYQQAASHRSGVLFFVPFLNAFLLLFCCSMSTKGERQIVNQWGKILAGNDVQNSTLGCKTSSNEQISSKTQGFKKPQRQLFIWTLHSEQDFLKRLGSFQLPQVWQALHRPFVIYNELT